MKLRFILFLLFLVMGDVAFAQENFISRLLDTPTWMASMREDAAGFSPGINLISYSLAGLGIIVTLIRIQAFGDDFLDGLLRFVAVSGLLAMTVPINNLTYTMWDNLRESALESIQPTMTEASDELVTLGQDTAILMTIAAPTVGMAAVATRGAQSVAMRSAALTSKSIGVWLNATLIPIFFFVLMTYGIILLSGMGLVFAAILLPVSAAMIMMSAEAGEQWMSAYIQFTVGSLLTVAFIPVAFGAAFNATVVQPVAVVNENFAQSDVIANAYDTVEAPERVTELNNEIGALHNEQEVIQARVSAEGGGGLSNEADLGRLAQIGSTIRQKTAEIGQTIQGWVEPAYTPILDALASTLYAIRGWLIRLFLLFILAGIGGYLILQGANSISGLVGGASLAVARQMARPLSKVGSANFSSGGGGGGGKTRTETGGGSSGSLGGGSAGALGGRSVTQLPAGPGSRSVSVSGNAASASASKSTSTSSTAGGASHVSRTASATTSTGATSSTASGATKSKT